MLLTKLSGFDLPLNNVTSASDKMDADKYMMPVICHHLCVHEPCPTDSPPFVDKFLHHNRCQMLHEYARNYWQLPVVAYKITANDANETVTVRMSSLVDHTTSCIVSIMTSDI
jgi:hypothetical protein